jgi:hypothetical protein
MTVLQNVRYERFAQEIAAVEPQAVAYIAAGFRSSTRAAAKANASRLLAKAEIQDRVRELQLADADRAEIDRAGIIEMLMEDRRLARESQQVAAAVRAAELIGKMLGMFIDRREIKTGLLDDLSMVELGELREALSRARTQATAD